MTASKRKHRDRTKRNGDHRFTVRGVRRDPVDIGKLSKALIGLAMAEAEREAQAEHTAKASRSKDTSKENARPGGEAHA
ncbi:hypothetical protein [Kibdelosporangium aridum]|uniref:Uncharacterized protein n=1 Tax=Kibdelosporangium aridum TaxID=2030 RepID=A0A1Y5XS09_KIBAR|nr:hypothetical protein [Kibdelosporangium aridum]SMD14476.1 hypothetical protein SAMN05661093_05055 [Kibdelosporangium aridum]